MVTATVANTPAAWGNRATAPTPWAAALWSEHGQTERFRAVIRHLDLHPGDQLLDFGCGTGRLCELLPPHVGYHAHDWSAEMRDRCRREQPRAAVYDTLPDRLFDHVIAVGPFNLADGWWKQRTWDTLAELWAQHTRHTLSVSVYRGSDPACLTYSELDLAAFARNMGCQAFAIDGTYLDNDLLLVMRR